MTKASLCAQPGVLHDDAGRRAVLWSDGHGHYSLLGCELDKRRYFQIIDLELLFQDIAALENADRGQLPLQYLTFEQVVLGSDTTARSWGGGLRGVGCRCHRASLTTGQRLDDYDYFIHMRDASHPKREFIQCEDPELGRRRDVASRQPYALGISSLDEWLSIEQEG